ncbi:type II secretion system protein [Stenotrophomonas acidaminiphila]|uniref:type II secretion system protein n=1 Tax=Stenotrophomonas acidaminiphila TaxID=128780 RepID=UPI00192A3DBB|nr:type II secretion system protein [Stenotrophomonas acidaminiphila]
MNKHKRRANGFGLVETLLTLGALSALSLGIYLVLSPTSAAAKAKVEQDNLRDLSTAVDRSFGLLGSFQGVSASRVLEDGLAPTRMVDGSTLRTAWGTSVTVAPHTVNAPADGFVVVYPLAPADVCPRLAAAVARDVFDIRVEGVSVFDGGQLIPSATAAACGQADTATMEFIYHSGLVSGTAVAAPPLVLPPSNPSVSVPTSAPMGAPVGPAGPVGPAAPVGPVSTAPAVTPAPLPVAPPAPATPITPTTPPAPVAPAPVAPPTSVAACAPRTDWNYQNVNCSAGSYGTIAQRQSQPWTCPEAWDAPVPGSWSGWTTTSNTCTACPGSSTQTETRWQFTSSACPSGQLGSITWEYQQSRSRSVSYNCPAGTTSLPPATLGGWSGWSNTGSTRAYSNTCAAACSAPAPSSTAISRSLANENRTVACPSGQSGTHAQTRTVTQSGTRTTTWACPGPTSSTSDTWGGYSYGTWATVSNNCAATAPSCSWETDVYSLAPNFGSLDGETVSYDDGKGGGCYAAWGGRSGNSNQTAFNACRNSIPSQPLAPGAYYSLSEYTSWGGGMENTFGYRAVCN